MVEKKLMNLKYLEIPTEQDDSQGIASRVFEPLLSPNTTERVSAEHPLFDHLEKIEDLDLLKSFPIQVITSLHTFRPPEPTP